MRTYEFKCKKCGKTYEDKTKETKLTCCSQAVSRVYSIGGVHFTGPGFYSTDSKRA